MVQRRGPGYLLSLFGMLTSARHQLVSWGIRPPLSRVVADGSTREEEGTFHIIKHILPVMLYSF